jgi:CRP-like cAMP-binding protein
MELHERRLALGRVAILASQSPSQLERIAATCKWRELDEGEQILSYHDPSTDVFFLASGKARVIIYSAEGKAVIFTDLRPGAMFGEIAAIDRDPRSAGVEAVEPCTVASMTAVQFERLLLEQPPVALATIRHVTREVRRLSERVLEFSTLMVRNRIHAELLRLAADAVQKDGQALLSPSPSLSDIASRVTTHREAVSRELSRLASIGLLRREGSDLKVTDIARLEKLVRETKGE